MLALKTHRKIKKMPVSGSHNSEDSKAFRAQELWASVRGGDRQALTGLFELFYGRLYDYGVKLVADRETVKDAIQELFLSLWEYRDNLDTEVTVASYLYTSFRRTLLRQVDKNRRQKLRNLEYAEESFDDVFNVEEFMTSFELQKEQREQLEQALSELTRRQKEVIFLRFYEGLSTEEVTEIMQISRQSVYNLVGEAIGRMQKFVGPGT